MIKDLLFLRRERRESTAPGSNGSFPSILAPTILGTLELRSSNFRCVDRATLRPVLSVFVPSGSRKKGLGRHSLQMAAQQIAALEGWDKFVAYVDPASTAVGFYQKCGFAKVPVQASYSKVFTFKRPGPVHVGPLPSSAAIDLTIRAALKSRENSSGKKKFVCLCVV